MPSQYVSLKDLSPMHRNRAIRVRLVRTYQIPELRGGQTSKSMELLLRDVEGAYIHANILKNDVAKYRDIFSEELFFVVMSLVIYICSVFKDVIGRVVAIYAPLDKIIAGKSSRLMDFVIADTEQNTLKCTVWDDHVATMIPFYNADLKEPLIVVLQLCRAKIVNGEVRITSSYDATKLHCNESFAEFLEFKSKLVSGQSPVRSISTATVLSQSEGIGDFTSGSKVVTTISDLLDQKENGDYYVPAEILGIEGSGEWYYISCTVRYKVVLRVLDRTGNAPFVLWDREVAEIVGIPAAVLFEKFQKESAIPPEIESLIGMQMIFKISLKMEKRRGPTSAFNVMQVLRDEELVSTYCTSFNDQPEKDLMSMMIEEDDDDEESDLEASREDEVNSPGNARQMKNNFTESEDCDTVKRCLMDQYSSSNKLKKSKLASIKQEKLEKCKPTSTKEYKQRQLTSNIWKAT
ncbi:uncharacterized protein LOC116033321 [Ipomoea triloba]|uniref:uncharacterized protein LOC116033321 n=1 Tax=Ipomoea triloba TaxID=35885 RepID=UPI00125DA1B9|nr:uncharacterized protein LOC116033321 [Ipomoea triloba]